jgi:deazaflavin-dependent oxidoreductase (nitroreductase family)
VTWDGAFRALYALLALLDPVLRRWVHAVGLGNVVTLTVPGRRTGRSRSTLLGLLQTGGHWYLGHPNGDVAWTLNLRAAGEGTLELRPGVAMRVRAELLPEGPERDAAILATSQHPFPGDLIYRLGRRHIRRRGVYFRIELAGEG